MLIGQGQKCNIYMKHIPFAESDKKSRGFVSCDSEEFKDTLIAFQEHNLTQSQSKEGVAMATAASKVRKSVKSLKGVCGHNMRQEG